MKITAAAIQMESVNGDYKGNQNRASELIHEAVKKGAQLILLPELALAGYMYADEVWEAAELLHGRTSQWLGKLCDQHNIYIGTCILESDGSHFYDTFILCGPGGKQWSHRKVEPAGFEAFFLKGAGRNKCVFETPLGKIGVVICFDTSKTYSVKGLLEDQPDILLNPFSCIEMPGFTSMKDKTNWIETYNNIPAAFAKLLRIPVVASNKTGDFLSPMPMGFGMEYQAKYIDRSCIVDKNGTILTEVDGGTGIAIAEVDCNSAENINQIKAPAGRWFMPVSQFTRFTSGMTQLFGKIRYALSKKRKLAASRTYGKNNVRTN